MTNQVSKLCIAILSALLLLSPLVMADRIIMKTGAIFEGKVLFETDEYVLLEVSQEGATGNIRLAKKNISIVEKGNLDNDEYTIRLKKLDTNDANAHYELGLWCSAKKLTNEATYHFEQAVQINPKHKKAHIELGHVLVNGTWQTPSDNLPVIQAMSKQDWENFEDEYMKASLAKLDKKYKKAAVHFEAALVINPSSKRTKKELAFIYFKAEMWGKAKTSYEEILEQMKNDPFFMRNYAKILVHHKLHDDAIKVLNKLIQADEKDADSLAALAYIQYVQADYETALATYMKVDDILKEKGLTFVPNALLGMGLCYSRMKDFKNAYRQYETILKHEPLNLEASYSYARALEDAGDSEKALKKYKFYYRYSTSDSPHRIEVARILKKKP